MKTRLLIDGDYYIYLAARKYEDTTYWGDGYLTTIVEIKKAKEFIEHQIEELELYLGADEVEVYLSCPTERTFRMVYNPDYKKDRFTKIRPAGYKVLRSWMEERFSVPDPGDLEADDMIGIRNSVEDPNVFPIVVSVDKDMETIPCNLVNPQKLQDGLKTIEQEDALRNFWTQVLMGDAADSYPGCKKVGPVTAKKLLKGTALEDIPELVYDTYMKYGHPVEDIYKNMHMAWIKQNIELETKIFNMMAKIEIRKKYEEIS